VGDTFYAILRFVS